MQKQGKWEKSCRVWTDGKWLKKTSPFDTTRCRSQSGGQSINFDFPTWLTPAKDGGKWEKVMAAFKLLHLLPLAASTRTPLLHCKYEGHVLPFFKVILSRILKLSCVILNQLYRMVSRKSSHEQLWLVTAYSTLWPKSLLCGRVVICFVWTAPEQSKKIDKLHCGFVTCAVRLQHHLSNFLEVTRHLKR